MQDAMLSELYKRAFQEQARFERSNQESGDLSSDRERQVTIAKSKLLGELIDIRTDQLRRGTDGEKEA